MCSIRDSFWHPKRRNCGVSEFFSEFHGCGGDRWNAICIAPKAAVANKQIRSHGHAADTIGEAIDAGEISPVTPYSYTRVTTCRVDREEAGRIKAKIGEGEHFCYRETQFNERVRMPTAEDLRAEREAVLPAEKRAELPHQLAISGLPDKFLANLPPVLLAK